MAPPSPASSSSTLPSSNVLLALPDGPIASSSSDASSHTTSLIGGYPTFPPLGSLGKAPEVIRCGVCHEAMPLLVQVYCPPEDGENDRTVYVWACPNSRCQRRDGSVRAYRASVRNEEYVRDVEVKQEQAAKEAAAERDRARKNPFALTNGANGSAGLFGSANPLFGAPPPASTTATSGMPDISSLTISPSSTTYAPPILAYQPSQYLTTIDEYLPPPERMDIDDVEETGPEADFRNERWEQLLPKHMDEVFERYVKRLQGAEDGAGQVLRYELGGVPLPYSSRSPLYHQFFPEAPTTRTPDDEEEPNFSHFYKPTAVPPCPRCGSNRVFEMQLIPSLISLLQPDSLSTTGSSSKKQTSKQSEEERRKELMRLAASLREEKGDEMEFGEMDWGSILTFGCEKDCAGVGEEWVAVDWEAKLQE